MIVNNEISSPEDEEKKVPTSLGLKSSVTRLSQLRQKHPDDPRSTRRIKNTEPLPLIAYETDKQVAFDEDSIIEQDGPTNGGSTSNVSDLSVEQELSEIHKISEVLFLASIGNLDKLKESIEIHKIDISAKAFRDYDKRTALHVASNYGCFAVAEWLVLNRAPINAVDLFNLTPLAAATRNRHKEVARLLRENGGKVLNAAGKFVEIDESPLKELVPVHVEGVDEAWEINPDRIVDEKSIGHGQFGEIFMSRWAGTPVVTKRLKEVKLSDKTSLAEFRAEIDLQHKLHHPNIVQVFGVVMKSPIRLVVEYMEGGTLEQLFRQPHTSNYTLAKATDAAIDIIRGLDYLHNLRPNAVVHRDLKPANLLLTKTGTVKLADFGLSKSMDIKSTRSDTFVMTGETGTYRYMAPEVFRHEPYGPAVDIYAFSFVAYQLFTWQRPFAGLEGLDACKVAMKGARPECVMLPKSLADILVSAWKAKAVDRALACEVRRALEKFRARLKDTQGCCTVS